MALHKRPQFARSRIARFRSPLIGCLTAAGMSASLLVCVPVSADVWVFSPSVALDQRVDDNYYLIPAGEGDLNATRLVGELGLSRESQAWLIQGLARVDALLTTTSDNGDEGLNSNQLVALNAKRVEARSRYGIKTSFKQDTPSRDIAADLSDVNSLAVDTGLDLTQSSNVARREQILNPYFEYDLTRRLSVDAELLFTRVNHDLPNTQEAIYEQYIKTYPRNEDGSFDGVPLSYNAVTIDDVGGVFTPSGELDDFDETEFDLGLRFKYTPITTLITTLSYSTFEAEVEPDPYAIIPFDQLIRDDSGAAIYRKARRESKSTTMTFKLGFERTLTPTLLLSGDVGVYTNTTDKTDTLRPEDRPGEEIPQERLDALDTEVNGWLASVALNYDAGLTRYSGKFSVDVKPSSSGAQVETNELIGEVYRVLTPRLNVSVRARAYEPDRLGARRDDRFARRFISFEPRIEWKATRSFTVGASYRYRRQKAQIDPVSADSNAILLSLKYTPPNEIRDAAIANGL